jgi:chemotaxis protein histidine kinase CheA
MQHNLDIQTYSLDELFHLLDLPTISPTAEQMLQAKRKVLKFHPDKSRLPTQYFIFYKSAYETVERYYREQNKVNRAWTESDLQYRPIQAVNERAVKKTLQQQQQEQQQQNQQKQPQQPKQQNHQQNQQKPESKQNNNFNLAFESIVKKPSAEPKNKWFYEEKPIFEPPQEKVQVKNMAQAMDKFKEKAAAQQALIAHQEVQTLASGSAGTQYFDDEEEDDDDAATNSAQSRSRQYISTDPLAN